MFAETMTVDVEGLLSTFLRSRTVLQAEVGSRIYTDLPHRRTYPLLLISRTGGEARSGFALTEAQARIECYHNDHLLAHDLASLVVAECETYLPMAPMDDLGCVSSFRTDALRYEPDPEAADGQGHARPRYVIEATVHCHP